MKSVCSYLRLTIINCCILTPSSCWDLLSAGQETFLAFYRERLKNVNVEMCLNNRSHIVMHACIVRQAGMMSSLQWSQPIRRRIWRTSLSPPVTAHPPLYSPWEEPSLLKFTVSVLPLEDLLPDFSVALLSLSLSRRCVISTTHNPLHNNGNPPESREPILSIPLKSRKS